MRSAWVRKLVASELWCRGYVSHWSFVISSKLFLMAETRNVWDSIIWSPTVASTDHRWEQGVIVVDLTVNRILEVQWKLIPFRIARVIVNRLVITEVLLTPAPFCDQVGFRRLVVAVQSTGWSRSLPFVAFLISIDPIYSLDSLFALLKLSLIELW